MSYMEQLFARLRKHGLVQGTRGPGGGYRLARSPQEISVAEVLRAVDDDEEGLRNSAKDVSDLSHMLWGELSRRVSNYLDGITIQDLLEQSAISDSAQDFAEPVIPAQEVTETTQEEIRLPSH